ncbi:MAG TPA: DinB family protein [Humibacillus xanthopallidus]|nr:DinB family protein [Humibacillus xanthopallidus]
MTESHTQSRPEGETEGETESHPEAPAQTQPESLSGTTFVNRSLRGARFVSCDLSDAVVRGSDVAGMEIDSPWLLEQGGRLLVNGVDVVGFVDAELNRRFPGRELREAGDPEGLRSAWAAVESAWAATVDRATGMPDGTVDATVDGEWSLAQTLRHLVMATDVWLGRAVLGREQPYHPVGLPNDDHDSDAYDASAFSADVPSFEEVLVARAGRQAMVRDVIGGLSQAELSEPRRNPHDPEVDETVLSCLRTILEEEWEHHRYAVRDLDALAAGSADRPQ